jgi:hypothetical protein
MKEQTASVWASDPQLPARVVQSLRRDSGGKGLTYLSTAADLIELLIAERPVSPGPCAECGEDADEDGYCTTVDCSRFGKTREIPNRQIKFTSVYADGDEVERVETVAVPAYEEEALRDFLFPYTGTGRESGHACYFAESVDGLEPIINVEWC